jgi:hypothetical protein
MKKLPMGLFEKSAPKRIVVKTYGRGSLLGLLGPLFAFFMASQGMNGWQKSAIRDMERDAIEMAKRGYRIVSSEERAIALFGIVYYKVTYGLVDRPGT